ncbi:outer membrane protein assembly factor BamB [Alloalcanivorax xenomutans]|uniref:outer membrane protein assembly factor BamB n=1 Tax=Alloalcanivorax xenomutans TaxID=1094342 RepID=UPI0009B66DD6|nr:outer membrane protein assembly factor BamB [Alloalcanivorax xenomutans]
MQPLKASQASGGLRRSLTTRGLVALVAGALVLTGCSSNPNAIEPNDLPDFDSAYKVKRLWKANAGDGMDETSIKLSPAVTSQQVFAADVHGQVYAFNREDGDRQWRKKTEDRISGGLFAGYGKVYYGTREGEAVALSAEDGSELWRRQLSSEILSAPTGTSSLALYQTIDGRIQALDGETGEPRWEYETAIPNLILLGGTQPVVTAGRVYAAFSGGKVVCLDEQTGSPIWERRVAEPTGRSELDRLVDINTSLIVENGGVFTATFQGKVAVLDWENGRPYWAKDISSHQRLSSDLGTLFVSDDQGLVRGVDQRSGTFLWQQDKLYGRRLTGTAVQDDLVVVGDYEGYLHWMDQSDGKLVARYRHRGKPIVSAPIRHDDVIYVLGSEGRLAAYRLEARD